MKKNYQKPNVKVLEVDCNEDVLAASGVSIGGNTGIGIGEGEPPSSGSAKSGIFDDGDGKAGSIWNN